MTETQIVFSRRERYTEVKDPEEATISWDLATIFVGDGWRISHLLDFIVRTDAEKMSAMVPEFFRDNPQATMDFDNSVSRSTDELIVVELADNVIESYDVRRDPHVSVKDYVLYDEPRASMGFDPEEFE